MFTQNPTEHLYTFGPPSPQFHSIPSVQFFHLFSVMSFVFDDAAVQTPFPVKNDERHDDADDDDDRRPILRRDDDDTPSPSRPKKTRADGRDDGGENPPSSILHRCKTWMMTLLGYSRAGDKTRSAKVKMPSWRAIVWHFVSVGLILCSGFCIFQVFMVRANGH